MGRIIALIILVITSLAVCAVDCDAARHCAPGAFLATRVDSVGGLVSEVSSNPVVAQRYARHFGVSRDKLVEYLKSNVKIVVLKEPMKINTYYMMPSGRVVSKQRLFPAGASMFVTKAGQPIIDVRCGNPVIARLPRQPKAPVVAKVVAPPVSEPETRVAAAPPQVLPPPPASVVAPAAPITAPVAPVAVQPVRVALAPAPISSLPAAVRLAAPLLLGAVAVHHSSSPPIVPEPGTMLGACAILAPVVFVFRRRRSK